MQGHLARFGTERREWRWPGCPSGWSDRLKSSSAVAPAKTKIEINIVWFKKPISRSEHQKCSFRWQLRFLNWCLCYQLILFSWTWQPCTLSAFLHFAKLNFLLAQHFLLPLSLLKHFPFPNNAASYFVCKHYVFIWIAVQCILFFSNKVDLSQRRSLVITRNSLARKCCI